MPDITTDELAAIDRLVETWRSLSAKQKQRVPTALAREVADVVHFRLKATDPAT
jgi:hypothetical protein